MTEPYEYGLWQLVLFYIGLVLFFGLSFLRPSRRREWPSMGGIPTQVGINDGRGPEAGSL